MSKENVFKDVYIVESSYAENYWYRVWSDGWIEQGGSASREQNGPAQITFIKPYTDFPNVFYERTRHSLGCGYVFGIQQNSVTTTGFIAKADSFNTSGVGNMQKHYWRAEGY